jgi:hypothetical protein
MARAAELNSVQKQLLSVLREVSHPDIGIVARTKSANDSLMRSYGNSRTTDGRFHRQAGKTDLGNMAASCCKCRIGTGVRLGDVGCQRA